MDSRSKTLERYRVPKKTNTEPLQLPAPKADPIENIITIVEESFKKPELSRQFLKLNKFWSFNVKEAETQYTNRRLAMEAAHNKVIESFGFVFLQSETELNKLVIHGQLRIGNLSRSHLGNPKHAVSLSQHADICQPEQLRSGIIVLVKYMKGRIKYVDYTEEQSQLDPQPDFDCHMVRNSAAIDSSITTYEAFHSTQVYVYEYDDVDIKEFPSQILLIGAAHFVWNGGPLYRDIMHKEISIANSNSIRINSNTLPPSKPIKRPNHIPLEAPAAKKINIPTNAVAKPPPPPPPISIPIPIPLPLPLQLPIQLPLQLPLQFQLPVNLIFTQPPPLVTQEMFTTKLIIGKPPLKASMNQNININLNIKLLSLLREPLMISNLLNPNLYLSETLPNNVLEEYLSLDNKGYQLNPYLINTFPLHFNDKKKLGGSFRPKYATHLFMVPASDKDRNVMECIISKLTSTNKVGVIHCNALSNILCYVFPNGRISRYLSLVSIDAPHSLHVVLLTEQHPQCLLLSNDKSIKKEQKIFQDILTAYEDLNKTQAIIPIDKLKKNLFIHHKRQYSEEFIKPLSEHPSSTIKEPSESNQKNNDSDMDIDNVDNEHDLSIIKDNSINNNHTVAFSGTKTNHSTTTVSTFSTSTINRDIQLLNNVQLDRNLDHSTSQVSKHLENNQQGLSVSVSNGIVPVSHSTLSHQSLSQDTTPELVISSTPKYYGRFTLIRVPQQTCIKSSKDSLSERIQGTRRRQVYLDSVIFEPLPEHPHITIYNGEF